ncbi:MAG: hypothetical protein F4069_08360 [Rhodothermaceae bacterium]|nr:hypothetical protein [Rhodothermaceae bacterium]
MKQFFALASIFLMSFLMIAQNAEAQRDSLRVEKEVIISADGDTMIVTKTFPMRVNMTSPVRGGGVIISADGDTMIDPTTYIALLSLTDNPGYMSRPLPVAEEVIVSADGDTMMVTQRSLRHVRDIVVWGDRPHPLHEAEVVLVSVDGDTVMVTKRGPERSRRGDREREVVVEREIIDSDGDTTIVSVVREGDRKERVHRPRTVRQIRNRLRQRSESRKQIRMHDVRRELGDSRELREMEVEARRLARQLRQADEESYQEKEEMLRAQLEKIFDYKQAMKMKKLDQKRSDIEEQSKIVEERQSNREAIIKDRINQLLGRGSSYRW